MGEFPHRHFVLLHIRQGAIESKRETHDIPGLGSSGKHMGGVGEAWLGHRLYVFRRGVGIPFFI